MKTIIFCILGGLLVVGGMYMWNINREVVSISEKESEDKQVSETVSNDKFEDGTLPEASNVNPPIAPASTPTPKAIIDNKKTHMITIDTNYGKIVIETYDSDAPNTVKNFVTLAQKGFYDGVIFHRVIKGFMIQGGDPTGTGMGGPGYTFADELNPNTASYKAGYKKGVVAMANAGPNTNGSQFFIMHQDYPLPNNYTIFGHVVSGQDVVDKIANVQVGAGDKPVSPVTMKKVTIE